MFVYLIHKAVCCTIQRETQGAYRSHWLNIFPTCWSSIS